MDIIKPSPVYHYNTGKVLNTEYTNSGRLLQVTLYFVLSLPATTISNAGISCLTHGLLNLVGGANIASTDILTGARSMAATVVFFVPPNIKYFVGDISGGGGAVTLHRWHEMEL